MNIVEFIAKLEECRKINGDDVDVKVEDSASVYEPDVEDGISSDGKTLVL